MKKEEIAKLQAELDVAKWYDGVMDDKDPCGSYDYCVKCVKEKEYPCANAKLATENLVTEILATEKKTVATKKENAVKTTAGSDKMIRVRKITKKVEEKPATTKKQTNK